MIVADLEKHYGQPYNNAYFEIGKALRKYEFYNAQGSVYLTQSNDFSNLFRAMNALTGFNCLYATSERFALKTGRILQAI